MSPQAANIELAGFAVLGVVIKAIEDAGTEVGANVSLDGQLAADIKSIAPKVKSAAPVHGCEASNDSGVGSNLGEEPLREVLGAHSNYLVGFL